MLEDKDTDDGLSVNWLEFLRQPSRPSEIVEIQRILSLKMKSVSRNSRIAVLNVGQAIAAVNEVLQGRLPITVRHDPASVEGKWDDPSHSGIYGLMRGPIVPDAQAAATALRDAISEVHPATPA